MNAAIITSTASTRRIPRWMLPGIILQRASLALARVRSNRFDGLDPQALHELQREADRLRAENFRTVAVGRVL